MVDSWANFVMLVMESEAQADSIVETQLRNGVIIRPLRAFGLPHCVRVSVGTEEASQLCVRVMREALLAPAL